MRRFDVGCSLLLRVDIEVSVKKREERAECDFFPLSFIYRRDSGRGRVFTERLKTTLFLCGEARGDDGSFSILLMLR